jgi:hypothetical protein
MGLEPYVRAVVAKRTLPNSWTFNGFVTIGATASR